ncbi:peptidase U32 family protein [Thermicanus aegyptius]|uniref:peptidase U32 family protein n=1 Tax=Thermicanus aegyptius TaxID=94009 RepID=UPI00041E81DE|nr:U32 family peptidase [Thermicanus aegyptius]
MKVLDQTLYKPNRKKLRRPELLAPAGNLEKLKFAVLYGADAVYIGGQQFGLRSKAGNFSIEDMAEGVRFAHEHGVKVYVAANIIAHNEDFIGLEEYLRTLKELKVDAVIIADPAIIETCKEVAPGLEIHLSTQASTTNWRAIQFWREEGVSRVVLARELSMEEIREIKVHTDAEIEVFIHGAMCMSYSGRCVLSNYMTSRDANRGGCAQSCRWRYNLLTEGDEGEEVPVFREDGEAFTMGSKDLALIEQIPQLIEAGVESLKIEGRMKTIHYVATVVGVYRQVIDAYIADPEHFIFKEEWKKELLKAANRPITTAFFSRDPSHEDQIFGPSPKMVSFDFVGLVLAYDEKTGMALVEQRNHFAVGDEIEFFGPKRQNFSQKVEEIINEAGESVDAARHPLEKVRIRVKEPVAPYDMIRKEKSS